MAVYTAAERPELWETARGLFDDVWPEYNMHGNHTSSLFSSLIPRHAHLQVLVFDRESDRVVARGRTIAFHWDGSLDDLPQGMDELGRRTLTDHRPPTAVSALAAEVSRHYQGRGLSEVVLRSMAACTRSGNLAPLVAPVRPSWKDRYPLIPIDEYAQWRRDDGLPFDPWLRVHARLGATILRGEPNSLLIEAPVREWEEWTTMTFPADGDYVFPLGLAPLQVRNGIGTYWEPNVWMLHHP